MIMRCESKFKDLACVLQSGHQERHRDRFDISAIAWDDKDCERTYSHAEVDLIVAAKLREAYDKIAQTRTAWLKQHGVPISQEFVDFANAIGELRDLIIPDAAQFLDAHTAEVPELKAPMECGHPKVCWIEAHWEHVQGYDYVANGYCTICAGIAMLKAQCAAMLEKAAVLANQVIFNEVQIVCQGGQSELGISVENEILSLIPTDYAAALAEVKRQARLEEHEMYCDDCANTEATRAACIRGTTLRAEGAKQP